MKSKRFVRKSIKEIKRKFMKTFLYSLVKEKGNAREEVSFPVEYTFFYKKIIFLPEPRFS